MSALIDDPSAADCRDQADSLVLHETAMRGYDRDELQDYDDYEDERLEEGEEYEDEEGEEYEEEEEPPKPTKEELDYLELRQKLKESIRKQMKKENSTSLADSSARKKKLPHDNFGSFFGPSQPVIAQRVIQESKSLLENQHLVSSLSKSPHINKSTNKVSNGVLKSSAHKQPPKVSEKQVKAQKLKVTRDYSFLLSDDADLPAPAKEPLTRKTSVHRFEGQPAQFTGKSKPPLVNGGKLVHGSGDNRKLVAGAGHLASKSGSNYKLNSTGKSTKASLDSRKQLGSNNGNGPGRPVGPKALPSKMPVSTMGNKSSTPGMKNPVNGVQKPLPPKVHSSVPKQSVEQRKDLREQNKPKTIPKQPVASSKAQVNKPPLKQISRRSDMQDHHKQIPRHSDMQDHHKQIPRRSDMQDHHKQIPRCSDMQNHHKQIPRRSNMQDHRSKNKVGKRYYDEVEDEMDVSSMIRSMFNYNPNRFVDDDDDDNMEAGFDEIMREEKRSAKIAKEEDEEQLRLIEEEEERERRRRMAKFKKRKLGE